MIVPLKGCCALATKRTTSMNSTRPCVCVCRCCSPSAGRPPLVTSAWSVSGRGATRSECCFIPPFRFHFSRVLINSCVQQRRDPGERQGPDQRGSYLRRRISAAWTPLIHRPLGARWHAAGPSTLRRRQHPGTQSENILLILILISNVLKSYLLYFLIGSAQCFLWRF